MIKGFLLYLDSVCVDYRITNGYEEIFNEENKESDCDILFKVKDFDNINAIISDFCNLHNYKLVQIYHQEPYAKNFFVFDPLNQILLNLDLYGELSRKGVTIFKECAIFYKAFKYKGISILEPHQEFIQYFIKKVDKKHITEANFKSLRTLYYKDPIECRAHLAKFFKSTHQKIAAAILDDDYESIKTHLSTFKADFKTNKKDKLSFSYANGKRMWHRIIQPTGLTISFLGPDGSGKSTIIEGLKKRHLPFRRQDYFHLKPFPQKNEAKLKVVNNPHAFQPYSALKSYVKLLYFIVQYNLGWWLHVVKLKIKSSLVIFDRYYDDILVDHKRYRYGGNKTIAKLVRHIIPKPDIYFILTADYKVIHARKQEVPLEELQRQLRAYQELVNGKRYIGINVNNTPEAIVAEITSIIMHKMNERY